MVLKDIEAVGFWMSPGGKGQWVQWEQMLVRFVEQREIQLDFLLWHTNNNLRKQNVSEMGNNRMGANLTVPTPMGHLAKIKILEYGAIG